MKIKLIDIKYVLIVISVVIILLLNSKNFSFFSFVCFKRLCTIKKSSGSHVSKIGK